MIKKLNILHIDEDIIVVDKPANVLSIPGRNSDEITSVLDFLRKKHGDVFPVHRLDKSTSGVICYARNAEAHKALNLQFLNREVDKTYLTIVDGMPQPETGTIDKPIAHDTNIAGKMRVHPKGKRAISHYKVAENFGRYALLEVNIETGRTHQIRVHCQAIGHPLLVDKLYAKRDAFFLSEIKKKKFNLGKYQEERPLLSRSSLHAHRLQFTHPTTNEKMDITAELPKDMAAVIKQMKKTC